MPHEAKVLIAMLFFETRIFMPFRSSIRSIAFFELVRTRKPFSK